MNEMNVAYPEEKVFGNRPKKLTDLGTLPPYEFDRAEYPESGGIFLYKKGLLFPAKGFVFPQAVQCVNVAKRLFIDSVHLLTDKKLWGLYFGLIFSTFNQKIRLLNSFLSVYSRSMILVIDAVAPERKYLIDVSRGLWTLISTFLRGIGIEQENAERFAKIFAVVINYDNAYHHRLIDVFSEIRLEELKKTPLKEINRVSELYMEREMAPQLRPKVKALLKIFRIMFLWKRVRYAFQEAVGAADWKLLTYDRIDRYNVLERGDYKFFGLDWPERMEIWNALHNFKPPTQLNI
jgi:hypothetical protein